ncbi:MAG TPA: RNA polymerase sigma factor [Tepidisphaeraceae bacterium]|jgi:RNA polymerase sigma-70 factor (ECF subfamily)
MQSAQGGDRVAFANLVGAFQDSLYNTILRIVGQEDEAHDLTQETFLKARDRLGEYHGQCEPYVWTLKIGVQLSISQLRKLQRKRSFSLDEGQAAGLARRAAEGSENNGEAQQQLLTALGQLDAEYRAILVLRDVENLNYEQVADILEIPVALLQTRLFRARLTLHDGLR